MIRLWLRQWMGITQMEARLALLDNSVQGLKQMTSQVLNAQAEVNKAVSDVRELRTTMATGAKVPIVARNTRQFRALMEEEL